MALHLHTIKPARNSKKSKKRVGRGNASGHGTYSTRGQKGQRSRSGGRAGLKRLGLRGITQNIPKKRGFKSDKPQLVIINLSKLDANFSEGELVTPHTMFQKGLIASMKPGVKVLGKGTLSKKLTVRAQAYSESAKKAIEANGGKAMYLSRPVS